MSLPSVTVITPVLNGSRTIVKCIDSVKMQSYVNIDHFVVDGLSTDGTVQILESQGVNFVSEKDVGLYDAFSKGALTAEGDIVHILNADDHYKDSSIVSRVVDKMVESEADLCHGLVEQVDAFGRVERVVGKDQSRNALLKKMRVAHPAVFVKKEIYEKYGGFSVGFKIAGDHEFLLRIWDKITICFLPKVLVRMQLGGASNSQVVSSYRESMAASLIHGQNPFIALAVYYLECLKNFHRIVRE